MTSIAPCVRSRDPPRWQDAERPGRLSWLPPQRMSCVYKSELGRRKLMIADEERWRRLDIDIAEMARSEAAVELLASAFADLLLRFHDCAEPTEASVGGPQTKLRI